MAGTKFFTVLPGVIGCLIWKAFSNAVGQQPIRFECEALRNKSVCQDLHWPYRNSMEGKNRKWKISKLDDLHSNAEVEMTVFKNYGMTMKFFPKTRCPEPNEK